MIAMLPMYVKNMYNTNERIGISKITMYVLGINVITMYWVCPN